MVSDTALQKAELTLSCRCHTDVRLSGEWKLGRDQLSDPGRGTCIRNDEVDIDGRGNKQ